VLLSYERVLNGRFNAATVLATTAVVLFRSELVLLYGSLYLVGLYINSPKALFHPFQVLFVTKAVPVVRTLAVGIATAAVALLLSVPLDSYFWQEWPLWPEGKVLYFNVWQGRSGEYGTSPYWWYFTSALPRALSASALLVPFGFMVSTRGRRLMAGMTAVGVVFVLAYSALPHKELRFVLYAVPLLNVPAARVEWEWDGIEIKNKGIFENFKKRQEFSKK
jgi:alpha-1,6-mannosyltransferase